MYPLGQIGHTRRASRAQRVGGVALGAQDRCPVDELALVPRRVLILVLEVVQDQDVLFDDAGGNILLLSVAVTVVAVHLGGHRSDGYRLGQLGSRVCVPHRDRGQLVGIGRLSA